MTKNAHYAVCPHYNQLSAWRRESTWCTFYISKKSLWVAFLHLEKFGFVDVVFMEMKTLKLHFHLKELLKKTKMTNTFFSVLPFSQNLFPAYIFRLSHSKHVATIICTECADWSHQIQRYNNSSYMIVTIWSPHPKHYKAAKKFRFPLLNSLVTIHPSLKCKKKKMSY